MLNLAKFLTKNLFQSKLQNISMLQNILLFFTESSQVHTSKDPLIGTPMTAMIVGIAGGFLALLIMIAAVFCAVRRIQKSSAAANTPPNSRPTSGDHPLELSMVSIINNYYPRWRWLVVDIYRAAKRQGKYLSISTGTEGDNCFSIYFVAFFVFQGAPSCFILRIRISSKIKQNGKPIFHGWVTEVNSAAYSVFDEPITASEKSCSPARLIIN